jgi:hypothetical protein
MESQPRVEHFPSRHICLILFGRIIVPLALLAVEIFGVGPLALMAALEWLGYDGSFSHRH